MNYGWVSEKVLLIFLDSNIFIYSQVEDLPEYELAFKKMQETKRDSDIGVNAIFVSECFHVLTKFIGKEQTSKRVSSFLDSGRVLYLPIERGTIDKAMKLALTIKSGRINDMILAQHALDNKADGFLTDNSRHFEGVTGLKILTLR